MNFSSEFNFEFGDYECKKNPKWCGFDDEKKS